MRNDIELEQQFNHLKNTLKLIAVDLDLIKDEDIEANLIELEGDYYTFFYPDNLTELVDHDIISVEHFEAIKELRSLISNIEPKLWNSRDFRTSTQWIGVNKLSFEIIKSILFK